MATRTQHTTPRGPSTARLGLRAKLLLGFGGTAAVTLLVALIGYWEVTRLGSAVYEIGVVRLPSLEGLNQLASGEAEMRAAERTLLLPALDRATIAQETARRRTAHARADRGIALYAPLPQTPEEAQLWRSFVPLWSAWRAAHDSVVERAIAGHATGDRAALALAAERSRAAAGPLAAQVERLLQEITALNYEVAADAKARSVASFEDVTVIRRLMLACALFGVVAAVGVAAAMGRTFAAPLVEMAGSLARIGAGDLTPRVRVRSGDEIGRMGEAVNGLVDALRTSEGLLRSAMEHSAIGIAIVAPDGRFLEANPALGRILGRERGALLRTDLDAVTHPDDRAATHAALGALAAGDADTVERELRYVHADGRAVWVQVNASVVRTPDGAPGHFVTQVQDVTERRATAMALRASEEKFSRVFMAAPIGMGVSRLHDGRLLELNGEFERILGFRADEVRDRTTVELGIWPNAADRDAYVTRVLAGGGSEDRYLSLRSREGRELTLRTSAHVIELGGESHLVTTFADITEQKRAETELRESEHRYRELVDGVRDAIFALSAEGVIEALSPAFAEMTGMACDAWVQRPFVALLHPDDAARARALLQATLANAPRQTAQLRIRTAGGGHIVGEISGNARQRDGAVVGVLGIARDVSDRVRLEEQLRQAQKMEAIGRLAGGVAHDFNNLLATILAGAEVLASSRSLEPTARDDLELIRHAARRGAELTRSLLAFSRQQRLELRVLSLGEVVARFVRMARHVVPEDIVADVQLDAADTRVEADAGALDQILMNLVTNARDAMPAGGTLRIAVERQVLAAHDAGAGEGPAAGEYAALIVADTGVGMDAETLRRVFEPFFTTKEQGRGTGLGMPMVYGLVRQHGGFVEIDSRPGEGTTVRVLLPIARGEATPAPAPPPRPRGGGGERILLVEDNAPLRGISARALDRHGYRVTAVADGGAALAALEALTREGTPPDLIVSDVVMPQLSGPELVRELRARGCASRILFTSGYAADELADREGIGSGQPFLAKPWELADLLRTIRALLDAPPDAPPDAPSDAPPAPPGA